MNDSKTDSDTATITPPEETKKPGPVPAPETPVDPMMTVKFPPLDNLGSHFYDNEAGTFWVGVNLRADFMALPMVLDAAKLPLFQAYLDFRAREAKRTSLITRVKEGVSGMKESLENMMGRVGAGKKSILK